MINALSAAVSGARMGSLRMDVAAHDIANVNTPGFEQSDMIQKEQRPGSQVGTIRRTPNLDPERSNTDLAKEFGSEMITGEKSYTANLNVIRVQDQMLGSLLDITG